MSIVTTLAELVLDLHTGNALPTVVAICGWADTGKSTLASELCGALGTHEVSADCISTDAFMKNRAERNRLGISGYNPLSIDARELAAAIERISARHAYVYYPYDNRTGTKLSTPRTICGPSVIVIEGIHAFHAAIRKHCSLRIFIHSDDLTLKAMRARANVVKRSMEQADARARIDAELEEFRTYVLPGRAFANVCVGVSSTFEYSMQESCLAQRPGSRSTFAGG